MKAGSRGRELCQDQRVRKLPNTKTVPEQDAGEKRVRRKHREQSRLRPRVDASGHELGHSRGVKKATRLALSMQALGVAAVDTDIPSPAEILTPMPIRADMLKPAFWL
jgi:hypothetical protein